jgi:hypothetical protein
MCASRIARAGGVRGARQLDAHINVAFALGQVRDLVCPVDHPRGDFLRLTVIGNLKDSLHPQRTQGALCLARTCVSTHE